MSKTLFIHTGTPKTGSSFLQSVFKKSSLKLAECGILYPGIKNGSYQQTSNVDINGQLLTKIIIYKTIEQLNEIDKELKELLNSLFLMGKNKVFLSDETLGILKADIWEILNEICLSLNIKLIIFSYFRRPENYYPSHWAQLVRNHGEIKPLIEFSLTTNLQVWRNILVMNEQVANTYIFSYESELTRNSGLLESVAKVLGINLNIFVISGDSNINVSLSLNALTAIRLINDEFGINEGRKLNVELTRLQVVNKKNKPKLPSINEKLLFDRHKDEVANCHNLYIESIQNLKL